MKVTLTEFLFTDEAKFHKMAVLTVTKVELECFIITR